VFLLFFIISLLWILMFFVIFLLCICIVFHHILVVHFWYTSWSFLCWVLLLVFSLLVTHLCCFLMLPCYVLLLLFNPSLFCASSAPQHCCIIHFLCSSASRCYVFWLLFNAFLLCVFSVHQHLLLHLQSKYLFNFLEFFMTSLLSVIVVLQHLLGVCSKCFLVFFKLVFPPFILFSRCGKIKFSIFFQLQASRFLFFFYFFFF